MSAENSSPFIRFSTDFRYNPTGEPTGRSLLPGFVRTQPGPRKRKKSKPFRLELEAATTRMERAILARRSRDAFPWPLVLAVGLSRLLPAPLYDRLLSGAGRKLRPRKETSS